MLEFIKETFLNFTIGCTAALLILVLYPSTLVSLPVTAKTLQYGTVYFRNPKTKIYRGPFNGTILKVKDADSVIVRVFPWPSVAITTTVRLRGIDTPEYRRAKCIDEKNLAKRANAYVRSILKPGDHVQVSNVNFGKYANRVIANIEINGPGGPSDLSETLLASGYAKPYNGKKKQGWCE